MLDEKNVEDIQDEKMDDAELNNEENEVEETTENSPEEEDAGDENTEEKTEEENPYEKQLKEMKEKNEKLERINRQKTAALKEARQQSKQTKEVVESEDDRPLTKKEMLEVLEQREAIREAAEKIKELTQDPKEQEVIRAYMKQGYNVDDAYLKANAHVIEEHKRMAAEENDMDERNSYLTKYSAGMSTGPKGSPKWASNPILKEAAKELDPETRKYLGR